MKKAADLLGAFFDENTLKSARGYSQLFSAWRSIAGERISAHSRIAELDKTILLIEADHPGWIQIIQIQQASLLEAVRTRFPELAITGLALRLQRDGHPHALKGPENEENGRQDDQERVIANDEAEGQTAADPVQPGENQGDDPYGHITDGDFKDLLRKLEHSIKAKNRDR